MLEIRNTAGTVISNTAIRYPAPVGCRVPPNATAHIRRITPLERG